MHSVVLIKQVPDTYGEPTLNIHTGTLDRAATDAVLDEIDERALEFALRQQEVHGGEVTVMTMGPERASEALRKALAMGADRAVHIADAGLRGADTLKTSTVLAAALKTLAFDLVVAGNRSTDGRSGAVPAMLAEHLGLPQMTNLRSLTIQNDIATGERVVEDGYLEVSATLPAVVSVTEKFPEPRYPSFRGLMRAKKKPVTVLSLADLGLEPVTPGTAGIVLRSVTQRPARTAGTKIVDDGTAGTQLAEFLAGARLI